MLKLTLRNLMARKLRLIMSTLAIVLGVGFLTGILTFNDGLRSTFNGIISGSTSDALVRAKGSESFSYGVSSKAARLTPKDIEEIGALPEVGDVSGSVDGQGMYLMDSDGKVVTTMGAPTLTFNYDEIDNMDGEPITTLEGGAWPTALDEVVLDAGSAEKAGYEIGDTVKVIPPQVDPTAAAEQVELKLTGLANFNGGGTAGSVLIILDTKAAQNFFLGGADEYTSASVNAADGVSQTELVDAIEPLLPKGYDAVKGDTVVKESQDAVQQFIGPMSIFLVVFAGIALLVGAFIIANTFSILVAQRVRELAMLRALGASRRQVTTSVLVEALLMGLIGSTIGIVFGLIVARVVAWGMALVGIEVGGDELSLSLTTVIAAYAVGLIVTLLSAYIPARRAAKVSPVSAMREPDTNTQQSLRRRTVIGAVFLAIGAALALWGLAGAPGNDAYYIGAGAVLWVLTTAGISPVLGYPVLAICRAVFGKLFGRTGHLAGENAMRNPRRTGATASALMIGLAVVSAVGVVAASMSKTLDTMVEDQFASDFIVQSVNFGTIPTSVGDEMEQVDGVETMSREQWTPVMLDGETTSVAAVNPEAAATYGLEAQDGTLDMSGNEAILDPKTAEEQGVEVGSTIPLGFGAGQELDVTVAGIYKKSEITSGIMVPMSVLEEAQIPRADSMLALNLADGADADQVKADLEAVVEKMPIVTVQDKAGFAEAMKSQVQMLLNIIYSLLALAVLIAVFGIINTLGLSVVERTREIGLLRAIGMSRARLRRMITLESVAISLLGALLGLGLGLVIGVLLRQAMADDINELGLPIMSLIVFLVVAVIFGVLAAFLPALRASRLKVLDAIATE